MRKVKNIGGGAHDGEDRNGNLTCGVHVELSAIFHLYSQREYRIVIPYTQDKVKIERSSEFSIVEDNQKQKN